MDTKTDSVFLERAGQGHTDSLYHITQVSSSHDFGQDLMKSIPTIVWPIFVLIICLIFYKSIAGLIGRIKTLKAGGAEFSFADAVNNAVSAAPPVPTTQLPAAVAVPAPEVAPPVSLKTHAHIPGVATHKNIVDITTLKPEDLIEETATPTTVAPEKPKKSASQVSTATQPSRKHIADLVQTSPKNAIIETYELLMDKIDALAKQMKWPTVQDAIGITSTQFLGNRQVLTPENLQEINVLSSVRNQVDLYSEGAVPSSEAVTYAARAFPLIERLSFFG
jgi:hypothetical protein